MITERALLRHYTYAALSGLQFGWTTWLAFVLLRGGNPGWAEAAFHLMIWLGEIPTGLVADRVGRRLSMLIGLGVGVVAAFSYVGITGTLSACLVLGLSGLGSTFLSGADRALLYETALASGGSDLARRALARANALQMATLAAAPVIAGFLYQWDPLYPALARGPVILVTIAVVWGMKETSEAALGDAKPRSTLWGHTREAIAHVLQNRGVLILLLFSWVYNTVGAMAGQFGQAYFPYTGLTMIGAGFIFAGARLLGAVSSWWSERLNRTAALRWLRVAPLGQSMAYLGMGLTGGWAGGALFLIGEALDGLISPTLEHQINEAIPSAHRATILSLKGAGFSMLMVVAFPAASYLEPITTIYLVTGGVGVFMALVWLGRWRATPSTTVEAPKPA